MNPIRKTLITFFLALFFLGKLVAAPVALVEQKPVSITKPEPGVILVDFGKVAFANVALTPPAGTNLKVTVHFGEKSANGRVDRKPPGTVRYMRATADLTGGKATVVAPPADARNTKKTNDAHPPAILTPPEWGVVLPFRWLEIEGWEGDLKPEQIVRRAGFAANWDDTAADFKSSNELLNRIWELCKYSIKATTFAGLYVDGDRERIPYEADSYLNQLSHYYTDNDKQMARDTFDRLVHFATWPTEWAPHMVFIAHADYMHTGDKKWLADRYEGLKKRTLLERAGEDGLIQSNDQQMRNGDIVDWPNTERDGYVFTKQNTVVNAFHLAAISKMAELAKALGKDAEAKEYFDRAKRTHAKFQEMFFDEKRGIYRDGIGTDHAAHHANFFPLAFGLVPDDKKAGVLKFLREKGMNCSVYASQYLLEGLFENGAEDKAIELITANNDRSWKHMVESGTTISWEAWDQKYKPNQDWNHAWGAAPGNLLPRFLVGVQPLKPGWEMASIRPFTGKIESVRGKVPTRKGPVIVDWKQSPKEFSIAIQLPAGMPAMVDLPSPQGSKAVYLNGKKVPAKLKDNRWILDQEVKGSCQIVVK